MQKTTDTRCLEQPSPMAELSYNDDPERSTSEISNRITKRSIDYSLDVRRRKRPELLASIKHDQYTYTHLLWDCRESHW